MKTPILQATAVGPPQALRYAILNHGTQEVWTGERFTPDRTRVRLFATPSSACEEMQEILKAAFGDAQPRRYQAPVEIEVYGDVAAKDVVRWLHRSAILQLRTDEFGNGPNDSLVLPVIHWHRIRPLAAESDDVAES